MGFKGADCLVLVVEKKQVAKLQEARTIQKICKLDDHIWAAFAGLNADARILINKAQVECQSHRLTVEDPPSVEYVARYVAGVQQKYTQQGGVRPFGVCTLIIGFDQGQQQGHLYLTEPSGIHSEWLANAIGKSSKTVREYLEKAYKPSLDRHAACKMAIRAILEVVQTGASSLDVAVMGSDGRVQNLQLEEIQAFLTEIEQDQAAEQAVATKAM